ncbi:MAG: hypothetical protein JRD64_05140 [Deltaproteobacteria bacterium]|jgi:hypothetical protein|nr:hypothetical protein [Deltaproteobacteria bacterium]MBW2522067.1 hypothetical protein [Deltaproteobacteria bacterium]
MSAVDDILPSGDRMKKTLCWISEMVRSHPEKNRRQIIGEAQIRFDLSPKECSFIERNLADDAPPCTEAKDLS